MPSESEMREGRPRRVLAWQAQGACTVVVEDGGGPWPELVRPLARMHHDGLPRKAVRGKVRYTQMRCSIRQVRNFTGTT